MAFTKVRSIISPTTVITGGGATPVGGTDDLLTSGNPAKFQPNFSKVNIRHHGSSFTKRTGTTASRFWDIALQFYMQGSGTAGTPGVNGFASIDALLRAAAMTVTATPATSIAYAPSTIATLEACTIWGENDGLLHKAANAVGNVVLEGVPDGGLVGTWTGRGDYAEPTIASISGFAGGTDRSQAFLNIGATITPSGGSAFTPVITSFRFDRGVDIKQIPDANAPTGIKEAFIADAVPTMTVDIALDSVGTNLTYPTIYANMTATTTHSFTFTHGSGAGKAITFTAAQAELSNISLRDADGYMVGTLTYNVTHSTNEGEFTISIA